jgi:hypothetical protein
VYRAGLLPPGANPTAVVLVVIIIIIIIIIIRIRIIRIIIPFTEQVEYRANVSANT